MTTTVESNPHGALPINVEAGLYIILFDKPMAEHNPAYLPSRVGSCTCAQAARDPLAQTGSDAMVYMIENQEEAQLVVIHWSQDGEVEHGILFGPFGENDRGLGVLHTYITDVLGLDHTTHTWVQYQPRDGERWINGIPETKYNMLRSSGERLGLWRRAV